MINVNEAKLCATNFSKKLEVFASHPEGGLALQAWIDDFDYSEHEVSTELPPDVLLYIALSQAYVYAKDGKLTVQFGYDLFAWEDGEWVFVEEDIMDDNSYVVKWGPRYLAKDILNNLMWTSFQEDAYCMDKKEALKYIRCCGFNTRVMKLVKKSF
jgi:hypothetical protein